MTKTIIPDESGYLSGTRIPTGTRLEKCGIVLPRGPVGAWDAGMVESPVVWWDPKEKRYGMVYTGYAWDDTTKMGYRSVSTPQVGLAWSDDLKTWEKDGRSPIYGPSGVPGTPDEYGTPGPFIWLENDTYYLYYFGTTGKGYERGLKSMSMATSPDLVSWTRHPGNPIIQPEGSGWRAEAIWHPHIVKRADTYYLFFNTSGTVDGLNEEFIGYATSTDLKNWTVDDANSPILMGSNTPGAWDSSGRAGDPSLYRIENTWFMAWYSWDRIHSADGLAMTSDAEFPLGWRVYENNPVLAIGEASSFDALHAGKPFIVRHDNQHYHFYTAVDAAESRNIALAVWPPNCTE